MLCLKCFINKALVVYSNVLSHSRSLTAGVQMFPTSLLKVYLHTGSFKFLHDTCVNCILDHNWLLSSSDVTNPVYRNMCSTYDLKGAKGFPLCTCMNSVGDVERLNGQQLK